MENFLVPMVVEQTGRGERGYDIYSRLLRGPDRFSGNAGGRHGGQPDHRPVALPANGRSEEGHSSVHQFAGRQRHRRAGGLRHDAVPDLRREHLLHRAGGQHGGRPAVRRHQGQAVRAAQLQHHDPPGAGRGRRGGQRRGNPRQLHAQAQAPPQLHHRQTHRQGL